MIDIQGVSADVGGYYKLDEDKANAVMRPSKVTIIFDTEFVILGKNPCCYEINQWVQKWLCAWRKFKNIFSRPLFTIIFRPKILILGTDSILRVKTMYESVK